MSQMPPLKKLSKTESLFVRAAKRPNALAMVRRVYRRQYIGTRTRDEDFNAVGVLLGMCESFMPIPPATLIDGLNPLNADYHGINQGGIIDGHYTKVLKLIIGHIRHQRVDTLPGFRSPLWVRSKRDV